MSYSKTFFIDVRLILKRCTDAGMGMTTRKMMSPQPQTEADNLENTVQMIKICHPAIEAHHIGHQFGNLTLHSWRFLTAQPRRHHSGTQDH